MDAASAEFLAGLYQPALNRFPIPDKNPHQYAKAAAWGQALLDWLAEYRTAGYRHENRQAVAGLLNFCRKLPWEVRPSDVDRWLQEGLAGRSEKTRNEYIQCTGRYYRFACGITWTSPAGRRLRLCRNDPFIAYAKSNTRKFLKETPLSEHDLSRLLAAFDPHSCFGRRDHAIFTVILETGLPLSLVLALRLRDLQSGFTGDPYLAGPLPENSPALARGRQAACRAVRDYLEADGWLNRMQPDDYLFVSLRLTPGNPAQKQPGEWPRRPLGTRSALMDFKAYVACAGLDTAGVTPEKIIYTGARRLLEAGASTEELAAFLRLRTTAVARWMIPRLVGKEGETRDADSPGDPPVKFRIRRHGKPGNMHNLRTGEHAERYRLSRLGIHKHQFDRLRDEDLPAIIAALKMMQWELLALPEPTPDIGMRKLEKVRQIVYITGLMKAHQARKSRQKPSREQK